MRPIVETLTGFIILGCISRNYVQKGKNSSGIIRVFECVLLMLRIPILVTVFTFCKSREMTLRNSENPNGFLCLFDIISRICPQNESFSTVFIMFS